MSTPTLDLSMTRLLSTSRWTPALQHHDNQDIKIDEAKLITTIDVIDDPPLIFARCSTAELNDPRRTGKHTQAVGLPQTP
eukprot:1942726-Pyramimonas_sp.AAC.1